MWHSLRTVPIFFHSGQVKQLSPSRTRSPCLWKLRGRSPLSSSVHLSPWDSHSSWRIFSSLLPLVLFFIDCRWDCSENKQDREQEIHKNHCYIMVLSVAKWNSAFITWLQTISHAPSEATIILRDCRSSCCRQDGKTGKRTVPSEAFSKHKLRSRAPFDRRHFLNDIMTYKIN